MTLAALALTLVLTPIAFAAGAPAPAAPVEACVPQVAPKRAKITYPSGKSIVADVVDTPESREKGLMCVTKLPRDYGMLFAFNQEMFLNFWMKNTLVGLDIVWIGADKKITVIHDRMKKSTVSTPDDRVARAGGTGKYVLELPAGAAKRCGLKAGDQLAFDVAIPER
jgi:uncharacterized membrane protein (UPF0127 family)